MERITQNGNGTSDGWWGSLVSRFRHANTSPPPYRQIAFQLSYDLLKPDTRPIVLVVSPAEREPCASASVGLSACLGEEFGMRTLLVDAVPQRPESSRILKCAGLQGFAEVLTSPEILPEVLLPTNQEKVRFLPAGVALGLVSAARPERIDAWLRLAERQFDIVVICGGSLLQNPVAMAIAPAAGKVLLLAALHETRLEDLEAAQDALALSRARSVGLVLTTDV